jgi:hypothetical protein
MDRLLSAFFFSILWYSCSRWCSSISWFSHIWLLTKYGKEKFKHPYTFCASWTNLEQCIEMRKFLKILQNFQFLCIFFQNFIQFATNKFQIFITVQDFARRKILVTVETVSLLLLVIKHSLNLKAPQAHPEHAFSNWRDLLPFSSKP